MSVTGWIVLGVIVVVVLLVLSGYNSLVSLRQRVNQSFADVDVDSSAHDDPLVVRPFQTADGRPSLPAATAMPIQ